MNMTIRALLHDLSIDDTVLVINENNKIALDGKKMLNKEDALKEIYTKMQLDEYLPYANYDGLEELLQPQSWPKRDIIEIQILHSRELLESGDKSMLITLFAILSQAVKNWRGEKGKDFVITLS